MRQTICQGPGKAPEDICNFFSSYMHTNGQRTQTHIPGVTEEKSPRLDGCKERSLHTHGEMMGLVKKQ